MTHNTRTHDYRAAQNLYRERVRDADIADIPVHEIHRIYNLIYNTTWVADRHPHLNPFSPTYANTSSYPF
jgi:hypothetical protein